jgi:hypothetical protein
MALHWLHAMNVREVEAALKCDFRLKSFAERQPLSGW